MDESFFRKIGQYSGSASSTKGAFSSLYQFVITMGSSVYGLAFQILILLILIFTGIAFLKGYMAHGAAQRQESKDMIARNFFVLMIGVSLTGIIATVFNLFLWS